MSAWIRYYFHVDPYTLSPKQFARLWRETEYLLHSMKPYQKNE
jgi:hypothetical protein